MRLRYVKLATISYAALAAVAPLLCAGITTWSPLRHWGAGPGKKVGVVGIGGLGHMGVKLAHALGAEVVAFTTSESKRADALALGAVGRRSPPADPAAPQSRPGDVLLAVAQSRDNKCTTLCKSQIYRSSPSLVARAC